MDANGTAAGSPLPPRDVADFHLRWSEFRPQAVDLLALPALTPQHRETLTWMIRLSDRVGGNDLG